MTAMDSRLPLPDVASLNPEQKAVYDSILASRGSLNGPFLAWMHSPLLASRAERLGAFCRYETSLALGESELLILCVASHYQCAGEQQIHEPIAVNAGISPAIVECIRSGIKPAIIDDRHAALYDFATELLATHRIAADVYERTVALFGERSTVEIVAILGYYALVALTLNAFEMQVR